MNTPNLLKTLLVLLITTILPTPIHADLKSNDRLDRQLIESINRKDMKTARRLLEKGANPEAAIGKDYDQTAVCAAINDRSADFLKLLVEFGASPNAYWPDAHSTRPTPLACAIQLLNFEAFDYLLENGADPSIDFYPDAGDEKSLNLYTAFTRALVGKKYPMALKILSYHEPHPNEIEVLVDSMENSPADASHPWNGARNALIEWTRARVDDFNPRPAAPIPEGYKQECLFSFRDDEEGLKKGTICH